MPRNPANTPERTDVAGASTYGFAVPEASKADPSRGHELERDALPPDADFSKPVEPAANAKEPGEPKPI